MNVIELIKKRRTIRQYQDKQISLKILKSVINAARLAPSARNQQSVEYLVVNDPKLKDQVFDTLTWGGQLPSERPNNKHQPAAYVIILTNNNINPDAEIDVGLAVENLVLAAWSLGIASCILGAIDRDQIRKILGVPNNFEIKLVVTLGYPAEKSVAFDTDKIDGYFRDDQGVLHIPKRKLAKVLHLNKF